MDIVIRRFGVVDKGLVVALDVETEPGRSRVVTVKCARENRSLLTFFFFLKKNIRLAPCGRTRTYTQSVARLPDHFHLLVVQSFRLILAVQPGKEHAIVALIQ